MFTHLQPPMVMFTMMQTRRQAPSSLSCEQAARATDRRMAEERAERTTMGGSLKMTSHIRGAAGAGAGAGGVGSLLRSVRENAGLTQDALARAAACSKAYLSLVESGRRTLSSDKAQAIEAALEIHDGRLQAALNWQRV